ncbi:carbohydrate ABC transporter permease [Microbispora corallina]|uniref:Sugar ABC transporter permease n=1 Tax=Microbispora corallina TaxID=83302 RepID=A0ABQ4FV76_9ACTN|nr:MULTISPECIES: carbohydrate ABC transporter permease [Microbispora]ETK34073.1 sugar ABC transporter permease [Microbispora sp. ATCC PTA-5024]GIH38687.1 sugar ABC transporter permease [Microbispora corallina]
MGNRLLYAALVVAGLVTLAPFGWTLLSSLSDGGVPGWPLDPSLGAYGDLLRAIPFWRVLLNSVVVAAVSTGLQVLTSSMAAYGFARLDFPLKDAVFVVYLATLMVPMQVLVVPLFIEMRTFDLVDTYAGLLAPTVASAFGVFFLRQAVRQVPRELDEAAVMDGAGHVRVFASVVLPLIRPALATFTIFAFMASWNAFLWPLVILRSPEFMTLPLGLATLQGQFTTRWDVVMAGSVVSVLPILVVYVLAQRHVIASVARTGLK